MSVLSKFEKWMLQRIIRKAVIQDYNHGTNIMSIYKMVRDACDQEFTEDNVYTRDDSLREWFEATQHINAYEHPAMALKK